MGEKQARDKKKNGKKTKLAVEMIFIYQDHGKEEKSTYGFYWLRDHNKVPRNKTRRILKKKGVPNHYTTIMHKMYEGAIVTMGTVFDVVVEFLVRVGLCVGYALSLHLLLLLMCYSMKYTQDEALQCLLLANNM